jgi:hypothetical protein
VAVKTNKSRKPPRKKRNAHRKTPMDGELLRKPERVKITPEIVERICEGLSKGTPLTIVCSTDDMPHDDAVRDLQAADPRVAQAIARARARGWDAIALEAREIADDGSRDYKEIETERGTKVVVDYDNIQRSKLRVETRLKLLAKWDPKRYGEAVTVKGDEENPIVTKHKTEMTEAELLAIAATAVHKVTPKNG